MKRGDLVTNSSIKETKVVKSTGRLENEIANEGPILGGERRGPRPDAGQYNQELYYAFSGFCPNRSR